MTIDLRTLLCQDGTREFFSTGADIACTKRERRGMVGEPHERSTASFKLTLVGGTPAPCAHFRAIDDSAN